MVLTGGTGFLGSHLTEALLRSGHSVVSLVRSSNRVQSRICEFGELSVVPTILDRGRTVRKAVRSADIVIYCAGSVRGLCDVDFEEANVTGLENIISAIEEEMTTPKIILISSLSAAHPNLSAYAKSKSLGEMVVRKNPNIEWVILRPTAVYGPGDKELLPLLRIVRAGLGLSLGPRGQKLTFIHVDDCIQAVLSTLENFDFCQGHTFELHDGKKEGYTWDEIQKILMVRRAWLRLSIPRCFLQIIAKVNMVGAKIFGYSPMLTSGKVNEIWHRSWICENKKIASRTGWTPTKSLKEGVEMSL